MASTDSKRHTTRKAKHTPTIRRVKVCPQYRGYIPKAERDNAYFYQPPPVPWVRLQGQWLESAGFTIHTPITIHVQPGRLVLVAGQQPEE